MAFIKDIKKENSITLYKFTGEGLEISANSQALIEDPMYVKACFVDLETTGLSYADDEIIEIGKKGIGFKKFLQKIPTKKTLLFVINWRNS